MIRIARNFEKQRGDFLFQMTISWFGPPLVHPPYYRDVSSTLPSYSFFFFFTDQIFRVNFREKAAKLRQGKLVMENNWPKILSWPIDVDIDPVISTIIRDFIMAGRSPRTGKTNYCCLSRGRRVEPGFVLNQNCVFNCVECCVKTLLNIRTLYKFTFFLNFFAAVLRAVLSF